MRIRTAILQRILNSNRQKLLVVESAGTNFVVSTAVNATQRLIFCSVITASPVKTSVVDGTHFTQHTYDTDSRSIANVTEGMYWCTAEADNNLIR